MKGKLEYLFRGISDKRLEETIDAFTKFKKETTTYQVALICRNIIEGLDGIKKDRMGDFSDVIPEDGQLVDIF